MDSEEFKPPQIVEPNNPKICQMFGWGGMQNELSFAPIQVQNSSECNLEHQETFCATEILNFNTECGGNVGGPIFCLKTDNLTGIVVQDKFCGPEASGIILSVIQYHDWIQKVSDAQSLIKFSNLLMAIFVTALINMTLI